MRKTSKIKRIFAGLLALLLTVALLPAQTARIAKAADTPDGASGAGTVQTTDATIDTTKTGSLTIYKYEYNGADTSHKGTGNVGDIIPDGAVPLKDVGFTLYKVADVAELSAYYSTNPNALPDVNSFFINNNFEDGIDNSKVKQTISELKTGDDGKVFFNNLELGFYVVVETTKPDAVTTKMDPFLVSIPMTKVDGSDWLYDVTVYPKNATSYGGIQLEKVDAADNSIKLEGVTFKLEKKNTDDTWTEITKKAGAGGDNTGDALTLTTDSSGIIQVEGLSQGLYRFTETSLGNSSTNTANGGYILDRFTHYVFQVNADQSVYYDTDGNGTIDTAEENSVNKITVKNDKPDLVKGVKKSGETTYGRDADYNVGDKVPYQIVIEVPTNITLLDKFVVTDTPTHLTDDTNTIIITYGDTEAAADTTTVPLTAYTITSGSPTNGFTITFKPDQMADYAGKYIAISYEAELLASAVTTSGGNPNTAKLEYNNEIDTNGSGQGTNTIEDEATVYTFEIDIVKTGISGSGDVPLQNVTFDLYKEVTSSTPNAITGDDAKAVGLDNSKHWLKINGATPLTTDGNGKVSQSGLANGTYYLVETATNEGYNLLKAPVEVVLNITYTTTTTDTTTWTIAADGSASIVKHDVTSTTFVNSTTTDGGTGKKVQIKNSKGFTLPTTGGIGSAIFVFVGVSMMVAAVILFFVSRKKENEKTKP